MNKLPDLFIEEGRVFTTSLAISDFLEIPHKKTLRYIRNVIALVPEEFSRQHLKPDFFQDVLSRDQPMFKLTRSGFSVVGFGAVGKRAIEFRVAYIDAFDQMEARDPNESTEIDGVKVPASSEVSDLCHSLRRLGLHLAVVPD